MKRHPEPEVIGSFDLPTPKDDDMDWQHVSCDWIEEEHRGMLTVLRDDTLSCWPLPQLTPSENRIQFSWKALKKELHLTINPRVGAIQVSCRDGMLYIPSTEVGNDKQTDFVVIRVPPVFSFAKT
jgi:hypothetical protein